MLFGFRNYRGKVTRPRLLYHIIEEYQFLPKTSIVSAERIATGNSNFSVSAGKAQT